MDVDVAAILVKMIAGVYILFRKYCMLYNSHTDIFAKDLTRDGKGERGLRPILLQEKIKTQRMSNYIYSGQKKTTQTIRIFTYSYFHGT